METEYGIIVRGGGEPNPIAASSALINAYVASLARRIDWDFQDESPARDARGFVREQAMAPEIETHLVNAVLTNGARYYVDHAHPEYSGPECSTAWEAVLYDKAGEADPGPLGGGGGPAPAPGPADQRVQEQLRRQGQFVRVARELPDGPGRAFLPGRPARHTSLRHPPDLHRRRQGRGGGAGGRARRVPDHPAGRFLRRGGRPRDHAEAADRQHPRRAPLRRPEVPPAARHPGRRQPFGGGQLLEGRHHRPRAGHDRGRLVRPPWPGVLAWWRRCGPCARSPTT